MNKLTRIYLVAALAFALPSLVMPENAAAERKSILDGKPAVRKRKLLVKGRLELSPAFEASVNADFKHTLSAGLKAEYHLADMWSVGAVGFFGSSINTGLTDSILEDLPTTEEPGDPTPTVQQFEEHLNDIPIHGAVYGTVTPWYGKLAAFGSVFVNFDFYFSGGVSFAQLKNGCCGFETDPIPGGDIDEGGDNFPDNDPNDDPALNDGMQLGLYLGGGIHVFVNDWIALDLTVRNYSFTDNPSGLDFNADLAVQDDDNRFLGHLFMGLGVSFFLPSKVERTP